ncbi:hypothetical protein [Actinoplanes sp. NBRC 101535]|uniref:hypothetical protein n=1 Tax=Actinoplanes sp. NBRC 101535 TaxID=3032196 RepID=UPI0024A5458B|nr:hypothetical protein [Actinoplanes sp. NBRC 101535]GLY03683.1 hypothetical protein Acsp01_40620 [Actinoplanes sp. NBRC 101535]
MPNTIDASTIRRLLAAGLAAVAITTAAPAVAYAAPAAPSTSAAILAAAEYDEKLAVAVKFGLGDDYTLLELADRDFVIAIWNHVKDKPAHAEVRLAAEIAFSAAPEDADQASSDFILTEVFAAFDRDIARERQATEAKRASDLARTAAAASIDVVADATLLSGSDTDFIRLIWERVAEDAKWPKVKAAAAAARTGTPAAQEAFIATGLAEAARQDTDDRIAADAAKTEAEKAAELAKAAKRFAANRILLPVTDELLNLPDRDFIVTVWNFTAAGTEVQAAAVSAARSLDPAVWAAFITTGIHQARDRDIAIALAALEAAERKELQGVIDRAVKAKRLSLAAAGRTALAGNADAVSTFLRTGQFQVGLDVTAVAVSGDRIGVITTDGTSYVKEGALGGAWVKLYPRTKQLVLDGDRIGILTRDNIAYVKEGALNASWVRQFDKIKQIALAGQRVGLLTEDNVVRVKEGGLSTSLLSIHRDAKTFAMTSARIGVLNSAGHLEIKQGPYDTALWHDIRSDVKQFDLAANRVGVLNSADTSFALDGSVITGEWVRMHVNVQKIDVAADRVGVLTAAGAVRVKEGAITTTFVTQRNDIQQFAIDGDRTIVVNQDRIALVKEGALAATQWTVQPTPPPTA